MEFMDYAGADSGLVNSNTPFSADTKLTTRARSREYSVHTRLTTVQSPLYYEYTMIRAPFQRARGSLSHSLWSIYIKPYRGVFNFVITASHAGRSTLHHYLYFILQYQLAARIYQHIL